jgi:protein XagA
LSLLSATHCFAGAWTQPEGNLYTRVAFNYYAADKNFNEDGDRKNFPQQGDFHDANTAIYVEYGFSRELTFIADTTYKYLKYEDNAIKSESWGVGDIDIAARYLVYGTQSSALSVQGLVKIPETYDETDNVPLGNGQYDFELRVLYGHSLYPLLPGYCNFEAGYRFRREAPADEFRYLVEFGIDLSKNAYARAKLDGIQSARNGSHDYDFNGNPSLTNNFDLGKLDICIGYKISNTYGIEIACTPALYGENTAAGITWTIAFVMQR